MKIHSLFTESFIFLIILSFFILPPVITSTTGLVLSDIQITQWTFPFNQFTMALFASLILLFYSKLKNIKKNILGFRIFLTTGLLFTSYFFLNFLSLVIPSVDSHKYIQFSKPATFITWLFCILNFLFSAFYEEVIYRFYFTDTLISILTQINDFFKKKTFKIICEIIGCILFALAHKYLGFFAILNAAIAHFILRFSYKKANSIIPGVIAHFSYNMISLILL